MSSNTRKCRKNTCEIWTCTELKLRSVTVISFVGSVWGRPCILCGEKECKASTGARCIAARGRSPAKRAWLWIWITSCASWGPGVRSSTATTASSFYQSCLALSTTDSTSLTPGNLTIGVYRKNTPHFSHNNRIFPTLSIHIVDGITVYGRLYIRAIFRLVFSGWFRWQFLLF